MPGSVYVKLPGLVGQLRGWKKKKENILGVPVAFLMTSYNVLHWSPNRFVVSGQTNSFSRIANRFADKTSHETLMTISLKRWSSILRDRLSKVRNDFSARRRWQRRRSKKTRQNGQGVYSRIQMLIIYRDVLNKGVLCTAKKFFLGGTQHPL